MKTTLIKRDLKHLWHPYTQMKDCRTLPPISVKSAKGVCSYDYDGNFYYDTISSWWCNIHGHNHPTIKKAIKTQLDTLEHVLFAGFTHKPAIELAEKLVDISPRGLTRVFYSDNGSTAVEVALKMSYQYRRNLGEGNRNLFISLDMGYHGDTLGAMSVSGSSVFNEQFSPLFFKTLKAPTPYCYRCPAGKERTSCGTECFAGMEKLIRKNAKRISAVLLEPLLLGAGGMIIYPPEYLQKVRRLTAEYGIHLIADEVATGFGRTGKMFACDIAGIAPDFLCLSKGITSGYLPLGATLTTEKIFNSFYDDFAKKKTFYHGHTYTANPLACSAALASLGLFKKEKSLDNAKEINARIRKFLKDIAELPFVGDTREIGVIGAIELVSDKKNKTPFPFERRMGLDIYKEGLKNNLILRPLGNIAYFFLPLCLTTPDLDDIFAKAEKVLRKVLTTTSRKKI